MNYQKIIISASMLIIGIASYAFFRQTTQNNDQFIVGTTAAYAPWVSINLQGEYEGFDVDVMNGLAQQMGKKLILKDLGSMTSLFAALDQGSINAIIWGISITQDRQKKVAMIRYQGETVSSYPLIFWKSIPTNIRTIEDMQDKTICVEPASSQEAALSKYSFIKPLFVEKVDDALLNIQYGKADAALVEPAIAKKFKKKYPEIQILEVPLAPEDQVQGVGVVLKKNNTPLIDQVQQAVDALKEAGVIAQLEQKWGIAS